MRKQNMEEKQFFTVLREEFENRYYQCWYDTELPNPENVKSFMWNWFIDVFSQYKQELQKKIEGMKKEPQVVLGGMVETELSDKGIGYNQALQDILDLLTRKNQNEKTK